MSPAPVLVSGATGNVGREALTLLARAGAPTRAALRPGRIDAQVPTGVEPVAFDFERPETFGRALRGVRQLFLVRPPALGDVDRQLAPAIDAARAAGVEHVVFLSIYGCNPLVPHYRVESLLRRSGMAWTFLRASFFMQNLDTTHREEIRGRDELFVPAGSGRTSFVDVRDVAAVGVEALLHPDAHRGKAWPLTGSESLDYDAVARILTEELGRPIRYARPSPRAFRQSLAARGDDPGYAQVVANIYRVVRWHLAGRVTPHLAQILGRPPIPFRQYVRDYAACWARPA